jgi:hypothetical protein
MDRRETWLAAIVDMERLLAEESMPAGATRRVAERFASTVSRRRLLRHAVLAATCAILVLVAYGLLESRRAERTALESPSLAPDAARPGERLQLGGAPARPVQHTAAFVGSQPRVDPPPPSRRIRSAAVREEHRRSDSRAEDRPVVAADPPADDAASIIADVRRLRAAREYARAIARLEAAMERSWPVRTADVLGYELGTLLDRYSDRDRACDHWRTHLARVPSTRYRDEIDHARRRKGCAENR